MCFCWMDFHQRVWTCVGLCHIRSSMDRNKEQIDEPQNPKCQFLEEQSTLKEKQALSSLKIGSESVRLKIWRTKLLLSVVLHPSRSRGPSTLIFSTTFGWLWIYGSTEAHASTSVEEGRPTWYIGIAYPLARSISRWRYLGILWFTKVYFSIFSAWRQVGFLSRGW